MMKHYFLPETIIKILTPKKFDNYITLTNRKATHIS